MTNFPIIISCFLLWLHLVKAHGIECGLAEEGREHQIKCTLEYPPNQSLVWQALIGQRFQDVSRCDREPSTCINLMPDLYTATIISESTDLYKSLLTIKTVHRNQTTFRCVKPDDLKLGTETCDVEVYVIPARPTCKPPELVTQGSEKYMKVVCYSDNVYPRGDCTFTYRGLTNSTSVSKTASNSPSYINPENYKTTCELLVPVAGLPPGGYQFLVEVYPDLIGWNDAAGVYGDWTPRIVLSLPQIDIDSSCPSGSDISQGYILRGTRATCLCQLTFKGSPAGYAQWYDGTGNKVGTRNSADGSCLLSLYYLSGDPEPSYTCQAESILSQPDSDQDNLHLRRTYTANFAAGPTAVHLSIGDETFDLCPSNTQTVNILCEVPGKNVNPEPLFTLIILNETLAQDERGQYLSFHNNFHIRHFYRPTSGGDHRVYCKAVNEIFESLYFHTEKTLTVREPPTSAPVLVTADNQPTSGNTYAYVKAGSNVDVTCRVNGGFPAVSNVTVLCGNVMNSNQGSYTKVIFNFPQDAEEVVCLCKADHVTGCYDKETRITLTTRQGSSSTDPNSGQKGKDNTLSIGLGIGFACAFLIVAIVTIVLIILYRRSGTFKSCVKKQRPPTYDVPDVNYTNSHTYATPVIGSRSPPPQCSPPPPPTEPSHYDLINLDLGDANASQNCESTTEDTADGVQNEYIYPIATPPVSPGGSDSGYLQPIENPPVYPHLSLDKRS